MVEINGMVMCLLIRFFGLLIVFFIISVLELFSFDVSKKILIGICWLAVIVNGLELRLLICMLFEVSVCMMLVLLLNLC